MITSTRASIVLFGNNFSPSKAEEITGITFTDKHEAGQIGSKGKYKGQPYPFGHAVIKTSIKYQDGNQINVLLESIVPHVEILKELGVTYGKLQLTLGYSSQCNLEFDTQFLSTLAKTGLQFTISCVEEG